jgi:hypothetical protein
MQARIDRLLKFRTLVPSADPSSANTVTEDVGNRFFSENSLNTIRNLAYPFNAIEI